MDINNPGIRQEAIAALKEVHDGVIKEITPKFLKILSGEERAILDYLENNGLTKYKQGSWHRLSHNIIVPAVGINLSHSGYDGYGRKVHPYRKVVVPACILHDIGETKHPSIVGQEERGKMAHRMMHRHAGVKIADDALTKLNEDYKISMTSGHIAEIKRLIMVHDDPYAGIPIDPDDKNALALRASDRAYVPSFVSFYKDVFYRKEGKG